MVDAINVVLAKDTDARATERRLTTAVPGTVAERTGNDERRAAPFVVLERFHLAIAIVTVIASSVFLLALMLMLVEERRATVGHAAAHRLPPLAHPAARAGRGRRHRHHRGRCSGWSRS